MLRRWLAQKLCPEAFEAERRLDFVRRRMSELTQWCGYGFPEIAAALSWIERRERVHFMSMQEYDDEVQRARACGDWAALMAGTIDQFRDEISDRFDRRPERKKAS